jgi:ubiquinone/menaquinone biosynthesis C-methylase UbiE
MNIADAEALLATAVPRHRGDWADLGAGHGTFSRALARRLEPASRIYPVDRDRAAVASLKLLVTDGVEVIPVRADFTRAFKLPGVDAGQLSGLLLANALHFVANPELALARLVPWLRPEGRVVIIEYDGRRPSRWVPYPISAVLLPEIVAELGLSKPVITATRPSAYGGSLYVAVTQRLHEAC